MIAILKIIVKEARLGLMKIKSHTHTHTHTHTRGALITHTIDETFDSQEKEVIDFIDYNHTSVHLVCLVVDEFSIDEQSFNLIKLELEHIKHFDFIGVDELLSNFPSNTVSINLERLWKTLLIPFGRILLNKN